MRVLHVAIGVIVRDRRILVCQRKAQDSFGGYWEFPGGKCEPGESLEACLKRELREEIDLAVNVVDRLTPIVHDYGHLHLTLHPFWCQSVSGEAKNLECQECRWVEAVELRNYQFPPANETLLDEIVGRLQNSP